MCLLMQKYFSNPSTGHSETHLYKDHFIEIETNEKDELKTVAGIKRIKKEFFTWVWLILWR